MFLPGAVWIGVSADGLFAGVAAWSTALAVLGVRRGVLRGGSVAMVGGLLFGVTVYLSYGLALLGLVLLTGLLLCPNEHLTDLFRWGWVAAGAATVAATMTAAGFTWFRGAGRRADRRRQRVEQS